MQSGYTPIFEWCSNKNRIVISHPEDRLVLLAIRNTVTGEYISRHGMVEWAEAYEIDIVKEFPADGKTSQELIDFIRPLSGVEGIVVRFDDGLWLKIKADHYVLLHKSKDELQHEKNVVAVIVEGRADDFRILLSEQDRKNFETFEHQFLTNIKNIIDDMWWICRVYNSKEMTRKEAAEYSVNWKNHFLRSVMFTFFDTTPSINDIRAEVIKKIKGSTGSQSNVDKCRALWESPNKLKWVYN